MKIDLENGSARTALNTLAFYRGRRLHPSISMERLKSPANMKTTVSNVQIADAQLVRAIQLFYDGDFLCAIPLARNAEEVTGKLLGQRRPAAASMFMDLWLGKGDAVAGKNVVKTLIAQKKPKEARREIKGLFSKHVANKVRHALTHGIESAPSLTVDFELCALRHISMAVGNRVRISGADHIPRNIIKWFFEEFLTEEQRLDFAAKLAAKKDTPDKP